MTTRTIEIEDTLDERVESAIEDVKQELLNYLEQNPDTDRTPDIGNDLDYSGAIHEIVDGSVPIYTHEIDSTFYLYGSEIEQAFDDAGIGERSDSWPCGDWRMPAIYCYIEQKVHEWYQANADDVFEEWKAARLIHLLPTRGDGAFCGSDEGSKFETNIEAVTCEDCIEAHERFLDEQSDETVED